MHNETEQELRELVDFDLEPTCEALDGCGRTATWRVRLRCCGFTLLLCNVCVMDLMAAIDDYPDRLLKCRQCKVKTLYRDLIASADRI